ncbi:MAG TPA: hypothetical protein VH253_17925 [Phycisphaerae bacterium]|nr:hypothetical protein [Phycisphaerae bacterium]
MEPLCQRGCPPPRQAEATWSAGEGATAGEAAAYTGVTLPAGAHDIGVAGWRQWIQAVEYVRFEAPVDVCLRYAAAVVPGVALQPEDGGLVELDGRPIREGVLKDFGWFDLGKAKDVVGGGDASGVRVWVDRERGVFYFRKTD